MRGLWVLALCGCVTTVSQASDAGTCEVGATRACACGSGSGQQTCVAPESVWSGCGCADPKGPDVAVAPMPPAPSTCGAVTCASYPHDDTDIGAKACCTSSGACGSSSHFLFGDACLERGGAVGRSGPDCPSESINFVDLEGCCRADGACGLSIDAVNNFDVGCVERTAMQKLLNDGAGDRNGLSLIFILPIEPASFAPLRCTP